MRTIILILFLSSLMADAKEIETNEIIMRDSPEWLNRSRVEKIIHRIQTKLEWSTRKTAVHWHATEESFIKVKGLGRAMAKHLDGVSSIHLGPTINSNNFDEVFGHELVHVIVEQKYKGAIPKWIEEGLANHLANMKPVNYQWLVKQPFPDDVKDLAHPFKGSPELVSYRYKASQAFAEMLNKKCDLQNLIRLSVQRKMEDYMRTYCEIKDLNQAFKDWVKTQALRNPNRQ